MEKLDNGVIVCQLAKVIESRCDLETIPVKPSPPPPVAVRRQSVPVLNGGQQLKQQQLPHYHGTHYKKDGDGNSQPQLDHHLNGHHEEVRPAINFFFFSFSSLFSFHVGMCEGNIFNNSYFSCLIHNYVLQMTNTMIQNQFKCVL